MTWRYGMHCATSEGQLALARGDADAARRFAEEALEVAASSRSRKYESWAWRLKGESALMRHAWSEAEDALTRAFRIAETRVPSQAWRNQAALGALHGSQGRRGPAADHYTAARAVIEGLWTHTTEPGLRAGLGSTALRGPLA
jgi:hypothetical protein